MKKIDYSWPLAIVFFGMLLIIVTSCGFSEQKNEAVVETTDFDSLIIQLKNFDYEIIQIRNSSDSFILDSNLEPLEEGQTYIRIGGMLDRIDRSKIDLLIKNGDAKWVNMGSMLLRSFKSDRHVFTNVKVLLYLNGITCDFEKTTYVTFDIPGNKTPEIINTEIYINQLNDNLGALYIDDDPIIMNTAIYQNALWGENMLDSIVSVKIITNDGIQYHDDSLSNWGKGYPYNSCCPESGGAR